MRSVAGRAKTVFQAVICCAMALALLPALALGAESSAGAMLGSLVVPGVQLLDGSQQLRAAEAARWASPEARVARERSRTAYERLNANAAAKLAGEAFPGVVERPAGGIPQLSPGERILGYPTDRAAQVELAAGKYAVIDSTEPLATETSPGHREPIDLSLEQSGGMFRPARSDLGVQIPKRLADGVQLTNIGVSLTPVGESGAPLSGAEGAVDGATILYANTQTDADTLVRPTAVGFQEDTILRSIASPQQLSYRVGLPQGARLTRKPHAPGAVQIVDAGTVLAVLLAPSAEDAAGTLVPVTMSVSGDTIELAIDDRASEYQFPIDVDPTVVDEHFARRLETNWRFVEGTTKGYYGELNQVSEKSWDWSLWVNEYFSASEWGAIEFPTQGKSKITRFMAETSATGNAKIENRVGIFNSSKAGKS